MDSAAVDPDLLSLQETRGNRCGPFRLPIDIFVFLVWASLLLLPLFKEVSFFGMTFKKEIEDLKSHVKAEISGLRAEVRTYLLICARKMNQQSFTILAPSTGLAAPRNRETNSDSCREYRTADGSSSGYNTPMLEVSQDVEFLFKARFNLERELRRILEATNSGR